MNMSIVHTMLCCSSSSITRYLPVLCASVCLMCLVWWWLVVAVLPGTVLLERICLYWLELARLACPA